MFPPTSHHQPWSVATWPKFVTVPRLFHQVPDTTVRPEDCYLARWDGWPGGDSSSSIVLLFWPCFWTCCWIATKIWFQLFQHIDLRLIWSFHQISGLHGYVIGKSLIDLMQRPKTHIFLAGPWGSVFVGWRNTEIDNPKESFMDSKFWGFYLQNLHQIMDDNWPK